MLYIGDCLIGDVEELSKREVSTTWELLGVLLAELNELSMFLGVNE